MEKPFEFKLAAAVGGVLAIALIGLMVRLYSSWFLVLPLVLFDRVFPKNAIELSKHSVTGHRYRILIWTSAWLGMGIVANAIATDIVGEVVVIHDSDLMKLAGNKLKIWEANVADLSKIDIGSWLDSKFADERVPTLAQVLEICHGKIGVIIELKYYGHDQQLEQRVVNIVERYEMAKQVMVMSLEPERIKKLKSLRPAWYVNDDESWSGRRDYQHARRSQRGSQKSQRDEQLGTPANRSRGAAGRKASARRALAVIQGFSF